MATKKKPAPKKAAKPAPKKVAKPAAKKAAKPAAKKAAKPAPKKAVKAAKPAAKAAPKKAAKPAATAKKAAAKKPVAKKAVSKPAPKKTAKPAPKKVAAPKAAPKKAEVKKPAPKKVAPKKEEPKKPIAKKTEVKKEEKLTVAAPKEAPKKVVEEAPVNKLVSIPPKPKTVTKKEPPKPTKVVLPKITTKTAVKYEPDFTRSVLDSNKTIEKSEGPIVRYSDSDLQEFREIIQRKLDAAKKELNYLQGLITRKDEGGDMDEARYMTMEDGSVSMEREQLSQMASRQITFIDHLEKALMRIENKTYGICRVTGKLIDKARLRAVPHATLSIEAKQGMSK